MKFFTSKIYFHTIIFTFIIMICGNNSVTYAASSKNDGNYTVVIDAGHGGHDHGAIDNGAREKDINLAVAKKLASMIKKKMKNVNVVMTRDDDTFISLQERANIANKNKGDLFISIHTNSVDKSNTNRNKVAGTSVYALGPQKDANNLQVAQRENSVIELEDNYNQKYSGFDPSKDESYIIFELAQKRTLGQSLKFADKAQKELVSTAQRTDRGVKQAGFWVLWATAMPAVLVELDFICNPTEAKFLTSEDGQEKLATALLNAVQDYFSTSEPKKQTVETKTKVSEVKIKATTTQTSSQNNNKIVVSGESKEKTGEIISEESRENVSASAVSKSAGDKTKVKNIHPTTQNKNQNAPRRRRSESSRQISTSKEFETENIPLKNEEELMALVVEDNIETNDKVHNEEADVKNNSKNKKKKDSSTGKAQNKRNNNKKNDKTSISSDKVSKRGNKTIVVKTNPAKEKLSSDNSSKVQKSKNIDPSKEELSSQTTSSKEISAYQLTYKILLLSSDIELKSSDPVFAGIVPTGMYRENNQYKYTYGSSNDRREIENKLLEVKSILPDAVIVVRTE